MKLLIFLQLRDSFQFSYSSHIHFRHVDLLWCVNRLGRVRLDPCGGFTNQLRPQSTALHLNNSYQKNGMIYQKYPLVKLIITLCTRSLLLNPFYTKHLNTSVIYICVNEIISPNEVPATICNPTSTPSSPWKGELLLKFTLVSNTCYIRVNGTDWYDLLYLYWITNLQENKTQRHLHCRVQ